MQHVRATYKARDSWWTVLLVDPIAGRLVQLAARHRWLTPNLLTAVAFLFGLAAAGAFLLGTPAWLAAGAVIYFAGFVVDCMDGKIARLQGSGSVLGSWVDFILDRLRVMVCTVTLFVGQFLHTGNEWFLLVALGVIFLALFGYVNGAEIDKATARMATGKAAGPTHPPRKIPQPAVSVGRYLHRRRIRLNLVSGVEFEMAVFVIAPLVSALTGGSALIVVTALAAALLVMFELALIVRFWSAARSYDRTAGQQQHNPNDVTSGAAPADK